MQLAPLFVKKATTLWSTAIEWVTARFTRLRLFKPSHHYKVLLKDNFTNEVNWYPEISKSRRCKSFPRSSSVSHNNRFRNRYFLFTYHTSGTSVAFRVIWDARTAELKLSRNYYFVVVWIFCSVLVNNSSVIIIWIRLKRTENLGKWVLSPLRTVPPNILCNIPTLRSSLCKFSTASSRCGVWCTFLLSNSLWASSMPGAYWKEAKNSMDFLSSQRTFLRTSLKPRTTSVTSSKLLQW